MKLTHVSGIEAIITDEGCKGHTLGNIIITNNEDIYANVVIPKNYNSMTLKDVIEFLGRKMNNMEAAACYNVYMACGDVLAGRQSRLADAEMNKLKFVAAVSTMQPHEKVSFNLLCYSLKKEVKVSDYAAIFSVGDTEEREIITFSNDDDIEGVIEGITKKYPISDEEIENFRTGLIELLECQDQQEKMVADFKKKVSELPNMFSDENMEKTKELFNKIEGEALKWMDKILK